MSFFEKLKSAIKKIKAKLIAYFILVMGGAIFFLAPLTVSFEEGKMAAQAGDDFWQVFFTQGYHNIQKPFPCFGQCFSSYFLEYLNALKYYLLVMAFFALIGIIKAIPKHEFQDIENGSSDWCENGEQYSVLSRNKGIILAEKNYLPVDKRGNVNVLVVRRLWCW